VRRKALSGRFRTHRLDRLKSAMNGSDDPRALLWRNRSLTPLGHTVCAMCSGTERGHSAQPLRWRASSVAQPGIAQRVSALQVFRVHGLGKRVGFCQSSLDAFAQSRWPANYVGAPGNTKRVMTIEAMRSRWNEGSDTVATKAERRWERNRAQSRATIRNFLEELPLEVLDRPPDEPRGNRETPAARSAATLLSRPRPQACRTLGAISSVSDGRHARAAQWVTWAAPAAAALVVRVATLAPTFAGRACWGADGDREGFGHFFVLCCSGPDGWFYPSKVEG